VEKPILNTHQDTYLDLTVYTTARLKAKAETKALAPPLNTSWEELAARSDAHRLLVDAMVMAMAMRDRVNERVDDYVREQFRAAQGAYGAKRRNQATQPFLFAGTVG
jgi:hypothetical protein